MNGKIMGNISHKKKIKKKKIPWSRLDSLLSILFRVKKHSSLQFYHVMWPRNLMILILAPVKEDDGSKAAKALLIYYWLCCNDRKYNWQWRLANEIGKAPIYETGGWMNSALLQVQVRWSCFHWNAINARSNPNYCFSC